MDWIAGIKSAIDYIEDNITEKLDINDIASRSFSSPYHFQRVFGILCGYTVGEYIRYRRLTLAGAEISGGAKVINTALKYGYESPDSFTKAFVRFHGITPSQAKKRNADLKSFSRLSIKISLEGGKMLNYKIMSKPSMVITGLKRRFEGEPGDRYNQQHDFMVDGSTRFIRYALQGMANDCETEYCVISDISDSGYSFTVGAVIPEYFNSHLEKTAGKYAEMLSVVKVPEHLYVQVETERGTNCINEHLDLRKRLINEWLTTSPYIISNAPEITVIHLLSENKSDSYVELLIPIENK